MGIVACILGASLFGAVFYYHEKTSDLKKTNQSLNENLDELNSEYNQLKDNFEDLEDNYEEKSETLAETKQDLKEKKENYQDLNQEYLEIKEKYNSLKQSFEKTKNNYESLQETHNELKNDYEELEYDYNTLQNDYNSLESDYNEVESTLNDYQEWQGHLNYYRAYFDSSYYWGYASYSYLSYWKNKERVHPLGYYPIQIDLNEYILPNHEHSVIDSISNAIDEATNTDKQYAQEALTYVHNLVYYMTDENSVFKKEYFKYPTETVFDQVGDCEDTALLYASILKAMNIPCVLLEFKDPGHLAVGVGINDFYGTYYEYEGKKYFFAETTSNKFDEDKLRDRDYQIGDVPSMVEDQSAYIYKVD